ncbi:Metallo-hydrolase/oxidoreductase [Lentinus tigrinus ALCF2SS1-7]|uniref:Metallo-hydrolase/oxidoreductase n=1 Tax=Lentinus tigrinus ALCF2SS1-6 TaxID=1328759 RepID=A0A5C2SBM8_9APHY|nr:Metallo-hydrolase/oxidoreductase [Lentinus tigrinus ALCF2SS1-6]RPD75154.1 Metallo-hydrolase/oxidoreductase [Lentinus tigrinus ALCF2SS1-7]
MCKLSLPSGEDQREAYPTTSGPGSSAFTARRLTPSTFLIVEVDDVYDEHPFIYAKLVSAAQTILLLDTGCGGKTKQPDVELTSLREFIERAPVEDNAAEPLNPGGAMRYVVVLTHCHYDHILGVEQFACDSLVLASGYDPSFLAPAKLPEHSLCENLHIRTPSYTPSLRAHGDDILSKDGVRMGVKLLHTPGHTPDELALWDEEEAMLYVGDTLYEWAHIIFPNEGSIMQWLDTVEALTRLVRSSKRPEEAKINCGHKTANGPALEVLQTTKAFMMDVLGGREKVKSRLTKRGEEHVEYVQEGGRYSLVCPERLVEEARKALHIE